MKATEVTVGLAESNGSLLPGIWRDSLHRDQLRPQLSVTSMGKLYLFTFFTFLRTSAENVALSAFTAGRRSIRLSPAGTATLSVNSAATNDGTRGRTDGHTRVANRPGFPGTVPELACGVPCPGQGRFFPGIFRKVLQYDTIRFEMPF